MLAIEAKNLTKKFKEKTAVNSINLKINYVSKYITFFKICTGMKKQQASRRRNTFVLIPL